MRHHLIPTSPRRRLTAALALAALLLTACAPLSIYHKAGTSVATMDSDLTSCRVDALAKVPTDTRIERSPPRMIPRRICDRDGNCRIFHDYVPGEVRSYDANAPLRGRVVEQCMAAKGYTHTELPRCPAGIRNAAPEAATTVLPRLAPNSCAIHNSDGTWQIVTPG